MKKIFIAFVICLLPLGCAKEQKEEKVSLVILYGFMSNDPSSQFPVPDAVILKQDSGYIKIKARSGMVVEHSGRYSVIRK